MTGFAPSLLNLKLIPSLEHQAALFPGVNFLLLCGVWLAWPLSSGCETEARLSECAGQSGSHRGGRILPWCDLKSPRRGLLGLHKEISFFG